MKVKRIKLFEAFTRSEKIETINYLLLCWAVLEFIKDRRLFPDLTTGTVVGDIFCLYGVYKKESYFSYYPQHRDNIENNCDISLKTFLINKKIYENYNPETTRIDLNYHPPFTEKALKQVIKKMYEDEKNKAI